MERKLTMFCKLTNAARNLSLRSHVAVTVVSFAAFQGTRIQLDKFYAASGHPVDFATGQLAFSGDRIFGYYESMRAAGTFGIYVQTQLFDFLFIVSVMAFGLLFGTLLGKMGEPGSAVRWMGLGAAWFAFKGASFDAMENLLSFAMMQFEAGIPQALALVYSSFAALKFASLTAAMLLALSALILGLGKGGLTLLRKDAAV